MEYRDGSELKFNRAVLVPDASGFILQRWLGEVKNGAQQPISQSMPDDNAEQLLKQADQMRDQAYRQSDAKRRNDEAANALQLYQAAANKGSARANYAIGYLYETGTGVERSNDTAIRFYEKAASMGYYEAFPHIMLVQNQFKNYKGAVSTFFRFYKANPTLALNGFDNWSYSPDVLRAIQRTLKASGHYRGLIDGDIGPGTRAAIAAYVRETP